MGNRVALVSCVKSKANSACAARDLYISQLFSGMRNYAERHADAWFILSAEYGLVRPDQVISPYEKTLSKMCKADRVSWACRVGQKLLNELQPHSTVLILAGQRYREGIEPILGAHGYKVEVPMAGLKFGQQLSWLKGQAFYG